MGGMGFRKVKERADRAWELDRVHRSHEIIRRLTALEREHDELSHELLKLRPELFRGGPGELIHPDYAPDDGWDENAIQDSFDNFARRAVREATRDGYQHDD